MGFRRARPLPLWPLDADAGAAAESQVLSGAAPCSGGSFLFRIAVTLALKVLVKTTDLFKYYISLGESRRKAWPTTKSGLYAIRRVSVCFL